MANKKDSELIRNLTTFEEIDQRFVNQSVSAVVKYIDSLKFPVAISQSDNGYVPEKPKSEQTALYQNSNIFLDSGNGRVSKGLRGLELLSRLCKGVPSQNLFLFNNVIYSSNPNAVKNASRDELISIVIDNLGLTDTVANAVLIAPSLVENFRNACYQIGYQVRSGIFQKESVESQMLVYGKKLAVAAARSSQFVPGVTDFDILQPSPTPTPTPSITPSPSPIPLTPTPTPSFTPSVTASPTITPSTTVTPTATVTPTVTRTITPTVSVTPTISGTPSITVTPTQTVTGTPGITITPTPSPTVTPTRTPSATAAITLTPSPTVTPAVVSVTPTVTPTVTPSATAAIAYDPYFDNVVLLLNGQTLADTSGYARLPDNTTGATLASDSPFGGSYTSYQNSTQFGTTFSFANSIDFALEQVYTMEFWYKATDTGGYMLANDAVRHMAKFDTTSIYTNDWGTPNLASTFGMNTWVSVAFCRDADGNIYAFKDGVLVGTNTGSVNTTNTSTPFAVFGITGRSDLESFRGYFTNIRYTQGVCRYTGNYTPVSGPFPEMGPPIASPTPTPTVTATATPTVTPTITPSATASIPTDPFWANTVAYIPFTDTTGSTRAVDMTGRGWFNVGNYAIVESPSQFGGGSGLFDGSGDYVYALDSTDWDFGTGQFTIESYVNFNVSQTNFTIISQWGGSGTQAAWALFALSGELYMRFYDNTNTAIDVKTSFVPATGIWYHLAADRDASGVVRLYINGSVVASGSHPESIRVSDRMPRIGVVEGFEGTFDLNASLNSLRVTKGVARYAGAFTPTEYLSGPTSNPLISGPAGVTEP